MPQIAIPTDSLLRYNLYFIGFFLCLSFVLFLFILVSRWVDGLRYRKVSWMDKESQRLLSSYLVADEGQQDQIITLLKKCMARPLFRRVIMKNLLALRKNLLGDTTEKLSCLYLELGLYQYSKRKIYASSWNIIVEGIIELAEMNMRQDRKLIKQFLNHSHPIVRLEVYTALLRLRTHKPFSFLNKLEMQILEWEQMQLIMAAKHTNLTIPDLSRWLDKRYDSIVIFCLRVISYYNQQEAAGKVLGLLNHPSANVREEAVYTLRRLRYLEASPRLIAIYTQEVDAVKLAILRTLRVIAGKEAFPLYKRQLRERNRALKLAAAKSLRLAGYKGKIKFYGKDAVYSKDMQPMEAMAIG